MENSKEQDTVIVKLKEKISFLDELIVERQQDLEGLIADIQRLEGYSLGAKDSLQKIENHVVSQRKDIMEFRAKQQINADAFNFIDGLLNSTFNTIKNLNSENEKLILAKKVEHASKNIEISKLNSTKLNLISQIEEILNPVPDPPLPPQAYVSEISTELKVKNRKFRPDKNPNTRAGRASLDLSERRKKAKKKLEEETIVQTSDSNS